MTLRLDAQLICWDCCIILAAFLAMVGPSLKQGWLAERGCNQIV